MCRINKVLQVEEGNCKNDMPVMFHTQYKNKIEVIKTEDSLR